MMRKQAWWMIVPCLLAGVLFWPWQEGFGARISDVRRTKHNLSATDYSGGPQRTVKAVSETQICVFCHTPHAGTQAAGVPTPLWNRTLSTATYTKTYESASIDADVNELRSGPGGTSKLCLSCHDGTVAIGAVNVLGGKVPPTIGMSGTGTGGVMPAGSGATTGFTRNLGVDLSNDHPISFTFNAALATADGELRSPPYTSGTTLIMGNAAPGVNPRPLAPLDNNQVQCASCHDPHIRDPAETDSIKFLRLNRFQKVAPVGSTFSQSADIICLACHDKGKNAWAESAHANTTSASLVYKSGVGSPAEAREFPANAKVWEMACLNCHDSHTVAGSRRLLREGTDSTATPVKQGGNPAIEETCYQCHTTSTQSVLTSSPPDIESDFTDVGNKHMPITSVEQPGPDTAEAHNITNADFQESQLSLGKGNLANRHVECTDCHNPHRAIKNRLFNGSGATAGPTHTHDATVQHTNLASGALRGSWGVEPTYGDTTFLSMPTGYTVKKGDGGTGASTDRTANHVTREYQICLKCHSDYGYDDNGTYPTGNRPNLASFTGGTANNTNNLTQYTNQAMEFAAAANDALTGADQKESSSATANRRSFHPVIWPTGRTLSQRGGMANLWLSPWNGSTGGFIGNLTMYCTDCHGSATANGSSTPGTGKSWGPHGSANNFILKGTWDQNTGAGQQGGLCFKCHNYTNYATRNSTRSGFCCDKDTNLHGYHADKIGTIKCSRCHVAVVHGWKNKAFLANLNSVGAEAGQPPNTKVGTTYSKYTQGPYYLDAALRIINWKKSGNWLETDCGWSASNNGVNWMKSTCN
ncbi:MAG: hypothetical protein HQM03_17630 [Magnetococcales bacterium]|nr:hypothetical protein [Magnetococcales bacterium]